MKEGAAIAVGNARAVAAWSLSDLEGRERSAPRSYTIAALASRGSQLAIGDAVGAIDLWDVDRLESVSVGEHSGVTSLLLTRWRGEPALVSGGRDRRLRAWSMRGDKIDGVDI